MELSRHKIPHNSGNIDVAFHKLDSEVRPVIIFFHGNGENKSASATFEKLITNGNHQNLIKAGQKYGFNVLVPHFDASLNGYAPEWSGGTYQDKIVEFAKTLNEVDHNRIYQTGLSGGGGAIWDYIMRSRAYCDKIAAVLPLCGTPVDISKGNWKLAKDSNLPVWAFVGSNDSISFVNASTSQAAATGGKCTVLDGMGHNIASAVYARTDIYEWLLSKKRNIVPEIPTIPEIPDTEPEIPAPVKRLVDIKLGIEDGGLKASLKFSDGSIQEVK